VELGLHLRRALLYVVRFSGRGWFLLDRGCRPLVSGGRLRIIEVDGYSGEAQEGKEFFKSVNKTFKESEIVPLTSRHRPGISAPAYIQRGTGRLGRFGRFALWRSGCVNRKPFKGRQLVALKRDGMKRTNMLWQRYS